MKTDKLEKAIEDRMSLTQTTFDTTKSTFLTAGILVALTVSPEEFKKTTLFGHSGIKLVMICTILSAIMQVLSFVVAEHQIKRHDKLVGSNILATRAELFILGDNQERHIKYIPWFYGRFHNLLITLTNNLSTLLLLISLFLFLLLIIKF